MPAYELEVSALRLFHEIKKAKLQRNADCNHLAGETVYMIKLLQQLPYWKQRLNIHSAFNRHCSIAFQMPSWTFLIFFTTVPTYYVSHRSRHYLYADVMHGNLPHTTMQFILIKVLYLQFGYPSSQQPLPVPWLHLLMKTNVTSLVQSLLMEWQCRIAPLHVSGFHWKQIHTRLTFLLKKKESQTLYTLITTWTQFSLKITVIYNIYKSAVILSKVYPLKEKGWRYS